MAQVLRINYIHNLLGIIDNYPFQLKSNIHLYSSLKFSCLGKNSLLGTSCNMMTQKMNKFPQDKVEVHQYSDQGSSIQLGNQCIVQSQLAKIILNHILQVIYFQWDHKSNQQGSLCMKFAEFNLNNTLLGIKQVSQLVEGSNNQLDIECKLKS